MRGARAYRRGGVVVVLLAAGVLLLTGGGALAAGRGGQPPGAKTVSLSTPKTLAEYLSEPLFVFSPVKRGVKRRNPFLIPLTKIEIDKPGAQRITPEKYRELVRKEEERLKGLRRDLLALKQAVTTGQRDRALKLYQQLEEGLQQEFIRKISEEERDRLRAEFEALKPRISRLLTEAALASAQRKLAEIESAFKAGKHDEVLRLAGEFERLSAVPTAKESPRWRELSARVAALARRSRARIDFKNRDIRVTSLLVSRCGGVAVINGRTCAEGSRLDGETLVSEIRPDCIVFVFRGERIEYPLGLH